MQYRPSKKESINVRVEGQYSQPIVRNGQPLRRKRSQRRPRPQRESRSSCSSNPPPRPPRKTRQARKASGGIVLSQAVIDYVNLIVDPIDGKLCGMPVPPVLMTGPQRVWAKGNLVTDTVTGFGFAVASPAAAATSPNDCVKTSNATSGPTVSLAAGTPFSSNSTYANANVGQAPNNQYRTEAAVLRIRNTTPVISRGGSMVGLMEASHSSLDGLTFAQLEAFDEADKLAADSREWCQVLFRPVLTGDYDFKTVATSLGAANDGDFMGFGIQAPAGLPQTYEWEFYAVNEWQGTTVRTKQVSPVDQPGADAAHTVMLASRTLRRPHHKDPLMPAKALAATNELVKTHTSAVGKLESGAMDVASTVGKIVDTGAKGLDDLGDIAEHLAPFLALV